MMYLALKVLKHSFWRINGSVLKVLHHAPPKLIEISNNIKVSALWGILVARKY